MQDIQKFEISLSTVLMKKEEASNIHSLFGYQYPVGIGVSEKLHVFEERSKRYQYKTCILLSNEIREGTKAAYPVDELEDCCCIITPSCLEEANFYATVLHEFVHCYQSRTCESDIKEVLEIYQHAFNSQDYMWEINHDFPYTNPDFLKLIQNISRSNFHDIQEALASLKSTLRNVDYEYMIWQIWKEGFARFIENKILRMNKIPENNGGSDFESPNRTSFYFVGDHIWRQLELWDTSLIENIKKVFTVLEGKGN